MKLDQVVKILQEVEGQLQGLLPPEAEADRKNITNSVAKRRNPNSEPLAAALLCVRARPVRGLAGR